jgi:hypothetical protein
MLNTLTFSSPVSVSTPALYGNGTYDLSQGNLYNLQINPYVGYGSNFSLFNGLIGGGGIQVADTGMTYPFMRLSGPNALFHQLYFVFYPPIFNVQTFNTQDVGSQPASFEVSADTRSIPRWNSGSGVFQGSGSVDIFLANSRTQNLSGIYNNYIKTLIFGYDTSPEGISINVNGTNTSTTGYSFYYITKFNSRILIGSWYPFNPADGGAHRIKAKVTFDQYNNALTLEATATQYCNSLRSSSSTSNAPTYSTASPITYKKTFTVSNPSIQPFYPRLTLKSWTKSQINPASPTQGYSSHDVGNITLATSPSIRKGVNSNTPARIITRLKSGGVGTSKVNYLFNNKNTIDLNMLLIGGGGGGSRPVDGGNGGGGNGGAFNYITDYPVSHRSIMSVVVGGGGPYGYFTQLGNNSFGYYNAVKGGDTYITPFTNVIGNNFFDTSLSAIGGLGGDSNGTVLNDGGYGNNGLITNRNIVNKNGADGINSTIRNSVESFVAGGPGNNTSLWGVTIPGSSTRPFGGGGECGSTINGNGGNGIAIITYKNPTQIATGGTITSYLSGSDLWWVHTFTGAGIFNVL